jgi:hypothetical protein
MSGTLQLAVIKYVSLVDKRQAGTLLISAELQAIIEMETMLKDTHGVVVGFRYYPLPQP